MSVLVTGGAGFIGRAVVDELRERGEEVVVLDCLEAQAEPRVPDGVRFVEGYVGDIGVGDGIWRDVDRVVHLAALVGVGQSMTSPRRYVERNVSDTVSLLAALPRHVRRLVVASSMSCYGEGAALCPRCGRVKGGSRRPAALSRGDWRAPCERCGTPTRPRSTDELTPLRPASVYAISKRDQEEYALVVGTAKGVPTCALRLFNVYGPGQALSNPYTGAAAIFGCRVLNGEPPVLYEDGGQLRDFVFVGDVARAVVAALDGDYRGAVNIGTGEATSVFRLAREVSDALGFDDEPVCRRQYRVGDVRHCYADPGLAERELGWRAEIGLYAGVRRLALWMRTETRDWLPADRTGRAERELRRGGLLRGAA